MSQLLFSMHRKELWSVLYELRSRKPRVPITIHVLETHISNLLNPKRKLARLKNDLVKFLNTSLDSDSDLLRGNYNFLDKVNTAKTFKNAKYSFLEICEMCGIFV